MVSQYIIQFLKIKVLIYTCTVALAMPLDKKEIAEKDVDYRIQAYLTKFGYLPEANIETQNQLSYHEVQTALKNMQQFAGLPPTGIIDNATLALMSRPRCGNKDIKVLNKFSGRHKRYVHQGARWQKTVLTYKVYRYTSHLHPLEVESLVYQALKLWEDVSALRFFPARSVSDADIVITFGRGYHGDGYVFDGPSGVLAHAFFPGPDRGGDVHFDEDEKWSKKGDGDGVSFFAVAAHEFGHSLGKNKIPS